MTEFSLVSNLASLLIELLGVLFLFRSLENRNEKDFHAPALLGLLPLLLIYLPIIPGMNACSLYSSRTANTSSIVSHPLQFT